MGVDKKIKERMSDAVVKSYYKPWHQRASGRIFLTIAAIFLLGVVYFAIKLGIGIYHINKGEIYNPDLGMWLTEEQYSANQKLAADLLTDDDPWLGSEEPLVNVIAYESMSCPFCQGDQETIKRVIQKFGPLLRFTTRDFPTEGLHPGSFNAHLAAACANEQGVYWEYRDLLFANQDDFSVKNLKVLAKGLGVDVNQFDTCLDDEKYSSEIRQDSAEGLDLDLKGTPSYMINGSLIEGSISYELWEEIIGYILKEGY